MFILKKNKFSPFYFGGRVECFKQGIFTGEFEGADIQSAYPFAMIHSHPWGFAYFETGELDPAELLEKIDIWKTGFFTIQAISRGAFPYRPDRRDKLQYPCDNDVRVYNVTGHEIAAAVKTGTVTILRVLNGIVHDEVINFDQYVYHFYDIRREMKIRIEKNPLDFEAIRIDLFCKIFLNSLYGKYAANPEKYQEYLVSNVNCMSAMVESGYDFAGTLGPNILMSRPVDAENQRYYNVATAASITGFVRAYLWENICRTENPLYCDTDFILGSKVNVEIGKNLGQWSHEGFFDAAYIGGRKLYAFHKKGKPFSTGNEKTEQQKKDAAKWYKLASKGVRLSPYELYRVCSGDIVEYHSPVPTYSFNNIPTFQARKVQMTR